MVMVRHLCSNFNRIGTKNNLIQNFIQTWNWHLGFAIFLGLKTQEKLSPLIWFLWIYLITEILCFYLGVKNYIKIRQIFSHSKKVEFWIPSDIYPIIFFCEWWHCHCHAVQLILICMLDWVLTVFCFNLQTLKFVLSRKALVKFQIIYMAFLIHLLCVLIQCA